VIKKTSYLGITLLIKTLVGLFLVKAGALYFGVENYGLTGQVSNILGIISLISGCGVYIGLTKYFSLPQREGNKDCEWLGSAIFLVLITSIILIAVLLFFSEFIKVNIFNQYEYSDLILIILAFIVIPVGVSSISMGIVNGFQRDNLYYSSILIGSLVGLSGAIPLVYFWKGNGVIIALIWLVISHSITLIYLSNRVIKFPYLNIKFNKKIAVKLFSYGSLALLAGIALPISSILIRTWIQVEEGNRSMGIYQGLSRLSESYMQLPMMLLSSYYFAKFSKDHNSALNINNLKKSLLDIFVLMLGICLFIYILRDFLITMLFTKDFLEMNDYLYLQLIGDIMKSLSFLGATIIMARGYIITSAIGTILHIFMLLLITYILIGEYGLDGVMIGYLVTYSIYFIIVLSVVMGLRKNINGNFKL
jgi:O-antigen/teichoic acid export membrane protein